MKRFKRIVLFLCCVCLTDASYGIEFDEALWKNAIMHVRYSLDCKTCPKGYLDLIDTKSIKINEKAISLKFLNILESGPSNNRLEEYTTKASQTKVSNFLAKHQPKLCDAFSKTQVDPIVVTSLLYMETLFGSEDIPWFKALESLVSLAALSETNFAREVISKLKPRMKIYKKYRNNPKKWQPYDWEARAKKIAADWTLHLEAFLKIAQIQQWDAQKLKTMKSSWAGAVGYSQFMPNTALPYITAHKELDFWDWPSSFMLTSLYLRDKGFDKDAQSALKSYNSPKWYRDTIVALSSLMNEKYPTFCKPLVESKQHVYDVVPKW